VFANLTDTPHTFKNSNGLFYFDAILENAMNPPVRTETIQNYSHSCNLKDPELIVALYFEFNINGFQTTKKNDYSIKICESYPSSFADSSNQRSSFSSMSSIIFCN